MQESLSVLDAIRLNFNPQGLFVLNLTLAFIMFGVALGIRLDHFKKLFKEPKSAFVGIASQFLILPAITFLLILIIQPSQTVALGMLLVASCPGGNISNFISSMAKGNVALSVSLTAFSTLAAIILTPLNFEIWGGLYNATSPAFKPIEIDPMSMFQTVFIILGIPLIIGMWFAHKFPSITLKIQKPIQTVSLIIFISYVVIALMNNWQYFKDYVHLIFFIVLAHNGLALLTGYLFSLSFKLNPQDRRTVSIETGIQNSGLALVLIFNPKIFPEELQIGGMAIVAAWWGIWHIISGLGIAFYWSKR